MLRSALAIVRQPRYRALSALMLVIAIACVAAGTWQIVRFDDKVTENDDLRGNADASPVAVASLLPLTTDAAPAKDGVQLRTVTATGSYEVSAQVLVASRTVDDRDGYLVLTPFRTVGGTLLVVRGFVQERGDGSPLPAAAAPTREVTIRARVHVGESGSEAYGDGRVLRIVPSAQAKRLDTAVFDGYAELLAKQPGGEGLTTLPAPGLSNPAGGAVEPQHFAYVIQWFLFALLALAAPFAMAHAERKEQTAAGVTPVPQTPAEERATRLADRYGRSVR